MANESLAHGVMEGVPLAVLPLKSGRSTGARPPRARWVLSPVGFWERNIMTKWDCHSGRVL
jgi:hypothetical protein